VKTVIPANNIKFWRVNGPEITSFASNYYKHLARK